MARTKQTARRPDRIMMDALAAALNPVAAKPKKAKKAKKLKGSPHAGGMMRYDNFGAGSRTRCPRGSRRVKGTDMCRLTTAPIQATPLVQAQAIPVDMYNPYLGPVQMAQPLKMAQPLRYGM